MKSPNSLRATVVVLAVAACLASCKSGKESQPEKSVAAAETAENNAAKPAPETAAKPALGSAVSAKDDPLLGVWEVVEATGDFAEANKGMTYDFTPSGKARTRAVHSGAGSGGRASNRKPGEIIENEWSWRRTAPDTIEMTHENSPNVAVIKVTPTEAGMIMSWNNGGQVFTLARLADTAR